MRLRFLIRMAVQKNERREPFVRTIRSLASNLGCEARNPKWTTYNALEMDVFAGSAADYEVFRAAIEPLAKVEFSRSLSEAPQHKSKEEVIQEASDYFNSERFWECHEALEGLWRVARGEERRLLQGLILVCAALVHEQKGENDIALGIVRRALPQLTWKGRYYTIDIPALRRRLEAALSRTELSVFAI